MWQYKLQVTADHLVVWNCQLWRSVKADLSFITHFQPYLPVNTNSTWKTMIGRKRDIYQILHFRTSNAVKKKGKNTAVSPPKDLVWHFPKTVKLLCHRRLLGEEERYITVLLLKNSSKRISLSSRQENASSIKLSVLETWRSIIQPTRKWKLAQWVFWPLFTLTS